MLIVFGIACIGYGVHLTSTHPETIYAFGPVALTYSHVLFAVGGLSIVRSIWKWVND